MLPATNLESSDIRTLTRVLEDQSEIKTEMRIRKEFIMRDYVSYKEMATNELNHNNRLKERLQQLKANNDRDRERSNKILSIHGTLRNGAHVNIRLIAETQVKQLNESLQVKQTNFEKNLEEYVKHLVDTRPFVKAHHLKECEIAALKLSHQKTIEKENAEKERMKHEKLTMSTLFQESVVELADYVLQYHGIADKIKDLLTKTGGPWSMAPFLRPKPSQLQPSTMTSTSTHREAVVSSHKIQRPTKRKVVDFVPSDSGFGTNLCEVERVEPSNCKEVTVTNDMPSGISSEKDNVNDVQMVNDANAVSQEIGEAANVRMNGGDDASVVIQEIDEIANVRICDDGDHVNQEIDEPSSSYDIAAILQESIANAKTFNIDFNVCDTESDEEAIELLKS